MLTGAAEMEKHGTVVGHNLSWRAKEHITHTRVDFTELQSMLILKWTTFGFCWDWKRISDAKLYEQSVDF